MMDGKIGSVLNTSESGPQTTTSNAAQVESLNQSVEEMFEKVDQLEQKLNEVEQFYSNSSTKLPNTPKGGSSVKDKEKEKFLASFKKRQQDAASREAAATQRMQELMRQFGTILNQITQHKWAGPFMQPVDVVGLGLHDYYKEARRKEEEAEMQLDTHLEQEAAHAKMARDLSIDLDEVDTRLEELREMVLQKCRKMTTEEKIRLGSAITRLSLEDITKALEMIAQNDPTFQAAEDSVDVDIDAQSESTLWKLKFFVKDKLQAMKSSTSTAGNNNGDNNKRKREISEATAKSSQKKSKNP